MPRFVILQHDCPEGPHYDFMVEVEGSLRTWSLSEPPTPGVECPCRLLADHRLAYLDYEGPISGDRGSVTRWDRGTCQIRQKSDRQWTVRLAGERLAGDATVRRATAEGQWWFLLEGPAAGASGLGASPHTSP
jgi:hypothetical protein